MSDNTYIQIPPDSSGKRIRSFKTYDLTVSNVDVTIINKLKSGDVITGDVSGANVIYLSRYAGGSLLYITGDNITGTFQTSENISTQYGSLCTFVAITENYTQNYTQIDSDNPSNNQKIDEYGSSYVRFLDGNLSLSGDGELYTSNQRVIKNYDFTYTENNDYFYDNLLNGGSISYSGQESMIKLICDTSNDAIVSRTSKINFNVTPGKSNILNVAIAVGDVGKTGVVRRWGLYDDDDGVYFELENDIFSVNVRNSSDSSDTKIIQSDFNVSQLLDVYDEYILDVSKLNIYWLDYGSHGTNLIRFGVYSEGGDKITLHKIGTSNVNLLASMGNTTLPARIEQFNVSISASTSELKCLYLNVLSDSDIEDELSGTIVSYIMPGVLEVTNTRTPILTIRPSFSVGNSRNKIAITPEKFEMDIEGESVIIESFLNGNLIGSTFSTKTTFSEIDYTATGMTGGYLVDEFIVTDGLNIKESDYVIDKSIQNAPDGISQNQLTFTARTYKTGGTASLFSIVKWRENI